MKTQPILLLLEAACLGATILMSDNALLAQAAAEEETTRIVSPTLLPSGTTSGRAPLMLAQNANSYAGSAGRFYRTTSSKNLAAPLLIRFSVAEDKTLEDLTEDLNIMAHLLEKSLEDGFSQDGPAVKMGIPMTLSSGSPAVRAMYLEGFGTLFMLKVNFPLLGGASSEEKKVEERLSSEWDDAKRELFGEKKPLWESSEASPAADYDAGQVDALKTGLLQTLRNASNIRNLSPNDFVSVTVFGTPTVVPKTRNPKTNSSKSSGVNPPEARAKTLEVRVLDAAARRGTVMCIRVKKSDLDLFAKQKLNLDEFQSKVTINSYFASGYATANLNTF